MILDNQMLYCLSRAFLGLACAIFISTGSEAADVLNRPPGVVIAHSPAALRVYLGSPAIAVLADGRYVATHDTFGAGSLAKSTEVFGSDDRGQHWRKLARIENQYWSSLFVLREKLYIIGTTSDHGVPVIRRSLDGGKSWTEANDEKSGLFPYEGVFFSSSVPVVVNRGRVWRSMEKLKKNGLWSMVMSVPADGDLLDTRMWTLSNEIGPDSHWLDGRFGGWLEGSVVADDGGNMRNVLRVYYKNLPEKAAIMEVSSDGKSLKFDPELGFIDFPGGGKKFVVKYDEKSKTYWTLSNYTSPIYKYSNTERVRNTVVLAASKDLRSWAIRRVVLSHPDDKNHAFQYLDWVVDGDDIIAVSRTSFDDDAGGARSQHDSNYITFHRISAFRE